MKWLLPVFNICFHNFFSDKVKCFNILVKPHFFSYLSFDALYIPYAVLYTVQLRSKYSISPRRFHEKEPKYVRLSLKI
jgi:hypothetical protein